MRGFGCTLILMLAAAGARGEAQESDLWAELNAGRSETIGTIHSLYVMYTIHTISLDRERDGMWTSNHESVVEYWCDGHNARRRVHDVSWQSRDPAPTKEEWDRLMEDPNDDDEGKPLRIRWPQHAMETDAVLDNGVSRYRRRYSKGNRLITERERPRNTSGGDRLGFTRTEDRLLRMASADYLLAGAVDDEEYDGATFMPSATNELTFREGVYLLTHNQPTYPAYWQIDSAHGYLITATEMGKAQWTDTVVEGDYRSVHVEPQEAAPGIYVPKVLVERYLRQGIRTFTEIRVLDCRVNEAIDPSVFSTRDVGFENFAGPENSFIPSDRPIPVAGISMLDVTGERERLARLKAEEPPTVLGYTLRGEDGSPPVIPVAPAVPTEHGNRTWGWLFAIASVALVGGALIWRTRSA